MSFVSDLLASVQQAVADGIANGRAFFDQSGDRLYRQIFMPVLELGCLVVREHGWTPLAISPDAAEILEGADQVLQIAGFQFGTATIPCQYRMDVICLFRKDYVVIEVQLRDVPSTTLLGAEVLLDHVVVWPSTGHAIEDVTAFFSKMGLDLSAALPSLQGMYARFEERITP